MIGRWAAMIRGDREGVNNASTASELAAAAIAITNLRLFSGIAASWEGCREANSIKVCTLKRRRVPGTVEGERRVPKLCTVCVGNYAHSVRGAASGCFRIEQKRLSSVIVWCAACSCRPPKEWVYE